MLDIGPSELLLIVIVAVIAIGPKELPAALRTAGKWIGQMRRMSAHFRNGFDAMVREAEMEELEKKWAAQNAKIMREHPADAPPEPEPTGAYPVPPSLPVQPAEPPPAAAEARVVTSDSADEYRDMPVSGEKPQA
ncbi:MAG TPA: Sec-independent protein translocase protein TatB [Croceibacterium sp.]